MKANEIMSAPAIGVVAKETVAVSARMPENYNVGALPVCGADSRLCGMITDRDLAVRCLAAGANAGRMKVKEVMTKRVAYVRPESDLPATTEIMGRNQVRRLTVLENGKLCGMVSLGEPAANEETGTTAGETLTQISEGLSSH